MKWIVVLLLILITNCMMAQVAIIKDKDGFTNVRLEPNAESKVIHKIMENDLFYYDVTAENDKSPEWIKVYVPKNKYSINTTASSDVIGYIHSSRLLPIDQLEEYTGSDLQFKYNLGAFSGEGKTIDYRDQWISEINGRRYYGTDGGKPKTEIKSMEVSVKGNKIPVSKILYEDLFECNTRFTIYKNKDVYFVEHWNSDGAGGYLLVWAVDSNDIRQRLIMIP